MGNHECMPINITSLPDDTWMVHPVGRIGQPGSQDLELALSELLRAGHVRLAVDFSAVTYINSNTLKVLLSAERRARQLGGTVQLVALSPRVRDIIEMAGFDQLFVIRSAIGV